MRIWFKILKTEKITFMKMIKYIAIIAVGLMLFTACEQEDLLFDESMSAVGFHGDKASVLEVDTVSGKDILEVQILVTALTDAPSITVDYEVDTTGIANPAVEGVDFEIDTERSVTLSKGWGYYPITIKAIDNDTYDPNGNKSFKLKIVNNSQGYDLASEDEITITIVDDDHPLGWMFGDYDVSVVETLNGDNNYSLNISSIEGETDRVKIYGLAGTSFGPPAEDPFYLTASVSEDYSTMTIAAGQEWEDWNYGPTILTVWEDDNGEGEEVNQLTGTIDASDGVTITFNQQFTFLITEGINEGLGLQWAWNSDANANSPTATLTKK